MSLLSYLRNSVVTARFEPSARGFSANWCYFYDKPMDHALAAANGSASSGVSLTAADTEEAEALRRTVPGLEDEEGARLAQLACQQRCVHEIFCT